MWPHWIKIDFFFPMYVGHCVNYCNLWASLVVQSVKSLPSIWEPQARALRWKDPLAKEIATAPAVLPGKSHEQRSLVGPNLQGHKGQTELVTKLLSQFKGFTGGSDSKESAYNVGDPGSIPGLGRSPREGNGYPLQYSCLENSMDKAVWQATIHGVTESWTQLRD